MELNRALPELLMRRDGDRPIDRRRAAVAGIEKRFVFRPRSIDVYYRVTNLGDGELRRGSAWRSTCPSPRAPRSAGGCSSSTRTGRRRSTPSAASIEGVQGLLVRDVRNEVSVTLSSAQAFRCWSVPVETRPRRRRSARRVFQSHCFVPQWDLRLQPGESWENHLSVGFEKTQSA